MTIYEVPNIKHCTVRPIGDPVLGYRVNSNEGWYLHIIGSEYYKTAMALNANTDFSTLEVVAEADLPEGAEILETGGDAVISRAEDENAEDATETDYINALEDLGVNFNG